MSGLLSGVLLARTFSGLIAGAAGWRTVFAIAAAMMAVLGVVLWRALPDRRPLRAALRRAPAERRRDGPRRGGPAPADGLRRLRHGQLRDGLDDALVPALRSALRLRRGDDRALRPGRARRGARRDGLRPPPRPRLRPGRHRRRPSGDPDQLAVFSSAATACRWSCWGWRCSTSASRARTCSARG